MVVFALNAAADTFTVNSAADPGDGVCDPAGTGDGCTLREAITAANSNQNPQSVDTISFAIPGGGVQRISIFNQLAHDHPTGGDRRIHAARGGAKHAGDRR